MRSFGTTLLTVTAVPFAVCAVDMSYADTLDVPADVAVFNSGRALVHVTVRDDDGNGISGVGVEFRVADPRAATFEFPLAFTNTEGAAYTVVNTRPNEFETGEPRVERTTFTVSANGLESAPVPIYADAVVVDGVAGFDAPPLAPFSASEQVLVGYTFGGFLRPEELVGFRVRAWSVDPRVAEIAEGLVTGVDDALGSAVIEFPVTAFGEGVATFVIGFLDFPTYSSEVVILDEPAFRRGDCNDDRRVDISDAVCLLRGLFSGDALPGCLAVANGNGDSSIDISDPTYLLNHLFLGGPPPVAPFPECGTSDLEADEELGCVESSCP